MHLMNNFSQFANQYSLNDKYSSPNYLQFNWDTEGGVQSFKEITGFSE